MPRVGGTIEVSIEGVVFRAKGAFDYGYGQSKREAVVGHDGVHGFKELPQVAFIEGTFTDDGNVDMPALLNVTDATVSIVLANGKIFSVYGAWYAADGTVNSEEGETPVRFESGRGEETS